MSIRKPKKMTEDELASLVRSEIEDAKGYDEEDLAQDRATAIEYFQGEMRDLPAPAGRSSVVTTEVAEAVNWLRASLVRQFLASDKVFIYEPKQPSDKEFANQATEYVNYVFLRESSGYRVLSDVIHDALLLRNGIVKHWWDPTPETKRELHEGLTDEAYVELSEDPNIEVLEHTEEDITVPNAFGEPTELKIHSVRINRTVETGHLCIEALPPEEFLIDRDAKSIDDARFVAHRTKKTRSDLVEMGYDKAKVAEIPGDAGDPMGSDEENSRRSQGYSMRLRTSPHDPSMDEIELFECYVKADYDGDGIAEWRYVVMAGTTGGGSTKDRERQGSMLRNEEWEDEVPFTDFVVDRLPHRFAGRSVYDELRDIQRVKTTLTRQMLDNLYLHNMPQRLVVQNSVDAEGMNELLNPQLGGVIQVAQLDSVQDMTIPFVAGDVMLPMEYFDAIAEKRTGVSRSTQALNADAINQQKTATQSLIEQGGSYAKTEMYARNLAEMGMARLGSCLLKLIVKHQDEARVIRLRDKFVEMDPSDWNADMDVTISVGLGTGSRERDLMALQMIGMEQDKIVATLGIGNPIVTPTMYRNRLAKQVETANLRSPEQYFAEIDPETEQQMVEAAANQPDPEMQKVQAKIEADKEKGAADLQLKAQDMQMQAQMDAQRLHQELEMERQKGAMDLMIAKEKAENDKRIALMEMQQEYELRQREMLMEFSLQKFAIEKGANGPGDEQNIRRQQ